MNARTLLAVAAAFSAAPTFAGPPVDTSFLKRYAETRGFMLGRPVKPKFTPDGKHVLFLRAAGPTTPKLALFEFDVATGKTRELLSGETLLKGADENVTPEEKARRERQRVSVGGFADYHVDPSGVRVLVTLSGKLYVFDRATAKVRQLASGPGTLLDPKWSPDGKFVGYVRDFDVCAYDLAADRELAVTTGGTREKTHGVAEFVAQEEMDRHSGYWWSPDSTRIAYTEADHAGVEVWHIADPFKPSVAPQPQYYPRPGKKNVTLRLGVKPVAGGETTWVEWDRTKYEYLAAVDWSGFPGQLLIQLQVRTQHELALVRVDVKTGVTTALANETDPSWVNIASDKVPFLPFTTLLWTTTKEDKLKLLYLDQSSRNGQTPLLGSSSPPTSPAGAHITKLIGVGFNSDVHVAASPSQPESGIWRLGLDVKRSKMVWSDLTPDSGVHGASYFGNGGDRTNLAITSTTLATMPRTTLWSRTRIDLFPTPFKPPAPLPELKGAELPSVAAEPPFTPNVTVQKVGDYWTAVVRPQNFDPKKKYPVIVDVYGGPHHIHVQQAMRNWLIPQWLADQGFVVVAIDNRGTPGRGRDWERAIYQKFGTVPLDDQAKGLAALCDKFPELDRERVGIVGWSFGGYMAANAVLRKPDVFKAAVAGAPVTDWEDYDTHYTERYMGLLPESKAAYDDASLIPLAKDLYRPLLLVHGSADDNVYYRHSLKLADALFRAGKEFEALPLPGITHMYSADPQVTERLWERSVLFFRKHLGEPK